LGAPLAGGADLAAALAPHRAGNRPDAPAGLPLWPLGTEAEGRAPALLADGVVGAPRLIGARAAEGLLQLDARIGGLSVEIRLEARGPLLASRAAVRNEGPDPLRLRWLASLALPLPAWATTRRLFDGRWSAEMQASDGPLAAGTAEQISREGRPGFGGGQWMLLGDGDDRGRWMGAHLAWCGSHRSLTDSSAGHPAMVQMGAWLGDAGLMLAPGARWEGPEALVAVSAAGLAPVARAFHAEARRRVRPVARKVHFNSWEAVWFDVSEARAMALAEAAAELGCERFVLDDGWFANRPDDRTGLGDWEPCPRKFPNGLGPLIDHVEGLGLEFGLWVEPEMASPGSRLLTEHPDWALPAPLHRHQLALDMARADVRAHLFAVLDRLLRTNRIDALKWDHNRPVDAPEPDAHARGCLELIAQVAAAHPHVLIEGCASGGGRIAFDLLPHMGRFWPSDTSDPAVRLPLLRQLSTFLPPELLGTHVAPSPNPVTGGSHAMDFRAKVAIFGDMGVEADPARMTERERDRLRELIALHKRLRPLIGTGIPAWPHNPDKAVLGQMAIAPDGSSAVALVARAGFPAAADTAPTCFPGLDPGALYQVNLPAPWPPAARLLADPERWRAGFRLFGAELAQAGIRLPLALADSAWILTFQRVEKA
jgi:alpha-galactosidase